MLRVGKTKVITAGIVFLILPVMAGADTLGQKATFFIDPSYDLNQREKISATLIEISQNLYFYVDDQWWEEITLDERNEIKESLKNLGQEFDNKIYPKLTQTFGTEWKPGIDNDYRITVLIHPMIEAAGSYFNSADQYPQDQIPNSNQREMVYLNTLYIKKENIESFLAHEFMHLITFNQKERLRGVAEEIWLNEARAEYVSTFLGYDEVYQGSTLQMRVETFLEKPDDSLTEWLNERADYGVVNLFTQYLVDHYGVEILIDSLHSEKVGIASLNYALEKNGFDQNFNLIFAQWLITLLVNDCELGPKYCYLNPHLKNIQITPSTNFLPLVGESKLSVSNSTKNWAGNWYKIIGGKRDLILKFDGADKVDFEVFYLICDIRNRCSINSLELNKDQEGKVKITDFSNKYASFTLIFFIQNKTTGFDGLESAYSFSWTAQAIEKVNEEKKEAQLRERLIAQIEWLKAEIARIQAQIKEILEKRKIRYSISCQKLKNDLYFGMMNNVEVRCLQEFLKAQGPEIYPEGLITGNFLSLTKAAVIRFQEKYASEILAPWDLEKGTGYVGPTTRAKINQLLK